MSLLEVTLLCKPEMETCMISQFEPHDVAAPARSSTWSEKSAGPRGCVAPKSNEPACERHAKRLPKQFKWQIGDADRGLARAHMVCQGLHAVELGWTDETAAQVIENTEDLEPHTLIYCPEGGGNLDVSGQRIKMTAGQAMLLPSRVVFQFMSRSQRPVTVCWLRFSGNDSDYYVRTLGEGIALISVSLATAKRVAEGYAQLHLLLDQESSEWQRVQVSHLVRLVLGHFLGEKRTLLQSELEPHHPGVQAAVEFMRNNLHLPLSLGDISRRAGLSVSHFCAVFRGQIGMTAMDYFIQLKLQKARRLLVTTALTVQEVADQVGYDDRYYFSRLFRKLHGMPPMNYRRQHRLHA